MISQLFQYSKYYDRGLARGSHSVVNLLIEVNLRGHKKNFNFLSNCKYSEDRQLDSKSY